MYRKEGKEKKILPGVNGVSNLESGEKCELRAGNWKQRRGKERVYSIKSFCLILFSPTFLLFVLMEMAFPMTRFIE